MHKFIVGERVQWFRGAELLTGYITKGYDFHGWTKYRVRSNGRSFAVLPADLKLAE